MFDYITARGEDEMKHSSRKKERKDKEKLNNSHPIISKMNAF